MSRNDPFGGAGVAGHYLSGHATFFASVSEPRWRSPQRGALGALIAHWSLPHRTSALVSVPTGAGKTAIAAAAPYLIHANRVLVLVPSKDLRKQIAEAFETEAVLRDIGSRTGSDRPKVMEVTGRVSDWSVMDDVDVAVAIPNSISPLYYEDGNKAPRNLFDLVIIDEAHHSPAPTWRGVLDHFASARGLLLTATPQRRDGQRVPGELVYHYPLRQALDEGLYKPVVPLILDLPEGATRESTDDRIIREVVTLASADEHRTSTIIIRAASIARANRLAELYRASGLRAEVLSSRLGSRARADIVERLRGGSLRAVVVVDMLGEGFDLPSLRIAAYHDKHKSLNSTVQLIGRLVRVHQDYPQASILVAARDIDVFPQLQGVVRFLWEEDADWAQVLPGVIDEQVAQSIANRQYAALLAPAPPELSVEAIQPVVRGVVYEVTPGTWEPSFAAGTIPDSLAEGQRLRGQTILYAACTPTNRTMVVLTAAVQRPRWHSDAGLDSTVYDLHLLTWQASTQTGQPHLLMVNSGDGALALELLKALEAVDHIRVADPARLQEAFDSLARISVSNVGVRNTYLGSRGVPSYRTFAGSGVERGLRDADTARGALGHAMAQVTAGSRTYTAGIATAKGKFWETRYVALREYEDSLVGYATRYWFPPAGGPGRLLPNVARGERLTQFPSCDIAAIEMNPALYGMGWHLANGASVDELDLQTDSTRPRTPYVLPLRAMDPASPDAPVWQGSQDALGNFTDVLPVPVQRGFGALRSVAELLNDHPPSVYFLEGETVSGGVLYRPPPRTVHLPDIGYELHTWANVDRTAETRRNAVTKGKGISIHQELETWLASQPRRGAHRWILCNDGAREIADYIVLEIDPGLRVTLSLWHAKGAGGTNASVRVTDMQVVIAQAIKSRRWATDRTFWAELGSRLGGRTGPAVHVVEGNERLLRILCGEDDRHPSWSLTSRVPLVQFEVGVAQPGLSMGLLQRDLEGASPSIPATQIRELLTVWHDAVALVGKATLLASS